MLLKTLASSENRMGIHKNAQLTPRGREALVRRVVSEGQSASRVAAAFGVSVSTVRKWVKRFRYEGLGGLADRSSRPHHSPSRTAAVIATKVGDLRLRRWTGAQIAAELGISRATVFRMLQRMGLNRLKALEPAMPILRYERQRPGELLHLDTKKLGRIGAVGHRITGRRTGIINRHRGIGWEYLHVCIDDASRLAYTEVLPDERKESAVAFLGRALAWFARLGVTVERIMTDNGNCYRSHLFRQACADAAIRHLRTKPYTPRTNGKAERFIQSALREWAYATAYQSSDQRTGQLPQWTHRYNWHRPHGSLKAHTPISRLRLTDHNLMRLHS
jgi:transposase InsO family protein/DNA-binding CsgD family transcriptional regulator